MSRTIEINGVDFELTVPRKIEHLEDVINRLDRYAHRTVWDCYDKPSQYKKRAWVMWYDWYSIADDELYYFGVSSYNTKQFTLQALYFDGVFYYEIRITKGHNKAILVSAN